MTTPTEPMANDAGADKAKADAIARELLLRSFSGKLCPYLSISGLQKSGVLVGATGAAMGGRSPEGEAVSCQGPNCMKFIVTSADQDGRPTGGACADAVLPSAILQLRDVNLQAAQHLTASLQALIGKYKFKPISG